MTVWKTDADNAGVYTVLPQADTVPVAPHILIAEDQPVIQELLRWTLQLAGYRATVCGGRHAVLTWRDKALPSGDCPLVLLLDLSLLRVAEAADFLRHLRADWRDVGGILPQIIVLTTSTQVQAKLGLRECVLQKPFHIRELLMLIQQVIRWLLDPKRAHCERFTHQTREEEGSLAKNGVVRRHKERII